jgi:hypothetical protein
MAEEAKKQDWLESHPKKENLSPSERKESTQYLWDGGGLLVGMGLTLMVTEVWPALYWPGVVCVYFGASSLARHISRDDEILPHNPKTRRTLAAFVFILICGFWSFKVVFARAPLTLQNSAWIGNYAEGASPVPGVTWDSSHFVDVRMDITNSTDYDYKDVDLDFVSDITILGAVQITQIPNVNFFAEASKSPFGSAELSGADSSGNEVAIPMPIPMDASHPTGFRMVCDRFPKHSTIKIILISAGLNYGPPPLPKELFAPKRLLQWIKTIGSYRAVGRERDVEVKQDF